MSVGALIGILGGAGAAALGLALYIAGRAIASVAVDELKGWLPHVAAALIASAVARLPEADRDRYREEWLAELLASQDRAMNALIFSLRVRVRVRSLVTELPESSAPDQVATASPTPIMAASAVREVRAEDRAFGALLRNARDEAGLSTAEMTYRLCYSRSSIQRYMSGARRPDRRTVEHWERECGREPGSLLGPWSQLPRTHRPGVRGETPGVER
jgi:hypothetical protein